MTHNKENCTKFVDAEQKKSPDKKYNGFSNKSSDDLETECLVHMASNGIHFAGPLRPDGKLYRFSIDGKKNQTDEFYSCTKWEFKGHFYLKCYYGTWAGGKKEYVYKNYENGNHLSGEDYKQFKEDEELRNKKYQEQQKKEAEQRLKRAKTLWEESQEAPSHKDHTAYLERKQVKAYGIKYSKDLEGNHVLVIPVKNIQGEIQAVQHIKANGDKKIHGLKRGNFHLVGQIKNDSNIFICEGYATGASVYEATNSPIVIAFDCGNLDPVLALIRNTYPQHQVTIAADDDRETKDHTGNFINPGKVKAEEAAKKYKCNVITPKFPEGFKLANGKCPSDFNDLQIISGIDELKKQIGQNGISTTLVQDELQKLLHNLLEKKEPCECFSIEALPKILRDYIKSISETTNAHPIMITCSVLTTISAILKKRVFIKEDRNTGYFQTLYANLWMLNVTKSGQFKSTALNKGSKLAWEQSSEVLKEIKSINEQIKSETDNKTKKDLEDKKIIASTGDPILPNKMTSEGLLEHLGQGHAGAILTSEFGAWLQNMDKSHNNDFKAIATDLYDVPSVYRYKTKSSGDYILEKPFISICGVSTLSWLKENLKHNDVDSGFLARFLIFAPPHQDEIPAALPRKSITQDKITEYRETEHKIKDILKYIDNEHPYSLTGEAETHFEEMHKQLYQIPKLYSDKCKEILDPYLKRWSPYLLKLAMIMRLFEDPFAYDISVTSLDSAMAVLLPAIKSTAHLFEGELGESEHQRKCRVVFDWICQKIKKTGEPVKWKDIITSKKLEGGSAEYEYICKTLMESGKLICKESPIRKDWIYALNIP
jgi:phage/plasmid primase-like uncharacterized protein